MSHCEFEGKLSSLRKNKKSQEEIFHNKVYLFNTQMMETNIKKLKDSLMQKTQFLQKHETIDNHIKETKYKLIKGDHQKSTRRLNQNYYDSSFSKDKNYETYQRTNRNNSFSNDDYEKSNFNQYNQNYVDGHEVQDNNEIINQNKPFNAIEDQINFKTKKESDALGNYQKDFAAECIRNDSADRKKEKSIDNETESPKKKTFGNLKKPAISRFLTSLDHTPNNNNDPYSQSPRKKLQKLSNKIAIKSRNMVLASTMKGNSEKFMNTLNNNNIKSINNLNNLNIDSALDNSKNKCMANKNNDNIIENCDIKDKINQSLNTTIHDAAESREREFLRSFVEKKNKNRKQNTLNRKRNNEKSSFNFSKSDSDFKLQEGQILKELNLLEKGHKKDSSNNNKKYNNNDLEDKNYSNNMRSQSNYSVDNFKINKIKDSTGGKTKNDFSPCVKPTQLNRNLKEIELIHTLTSLEEEINEKQNLMKKKLESLKSQGNNRKMTIDKLFSSTQYLLSNPNLITNSEINANLKSQIKFYNTQNNIGNFTAPEADENFDSYHGKKLKNSHSKKININTNILINDNYHNYTESLDNEKKSESLHDQDAKKETEKKSGVSPNKISNNYSINRKNQDNEKKELSNNSKNINIKELNKNEISKREDSNLINMQQQGKMHQNSTELDKNQNTQNFQKMKITDRVALMSKGILKESYDPETEKIFSEIFTKNLEQILEMKKYPIRAAEEEKINLHDERYEFSLKNYVSKEITDIKEKVYFLKGTLEYIFPQFLTRKLKETVKHQKASKIRNTLSILTENNLKFNEKFIEGNNENCNNSINNSKRRRHKTVDDSKSFTLNKDNEILIVKNTDKCSSNGNSKNEFFFPNINLNHNTYSINTTNSNLLCNSYNNKSNNLNNNPKENSTKSNYINRNNFHSLNNVNRFLLSEEFNLRENDSKLKSKGSILPGFRSCSFNNRYNLNSLNLNKTKLISLETNSSLFKKMNNFKNLSKNSIAAGNTNSIFWNKSMSEMNVHHQKKLIKEQILTKTLSIQNMNSFNG